MEPKVYLDGRACLVAQLTDAEVRLAMGLLMGNEGLGPLLERVSADVGDGGDRELIAALARVMELEGRVLELPA